MSDKGRVAPIDRGKLMWLSDGCATVQHPNLHVSIVEMPWGVHVDWKSRIDEGIVTVQLDRNHFIVSKSDLLWKKAKAVWWSFVLLAVGLSILHFGGQAEERWKSYIEFNRTHYRVRYRCDNCWDWLKTVVPNGERAGDFLSQELCPNCGVPGWKEESKRY